MKALIQTGSSLSACGHAQAGGRVPVPLKSDFLSINHRKMARESGMKKWMVLAGLAVAQLARGAYDGTGTFVKITNRADLAETYYVVATNNRKNKRKKV
jgi:hypothetical protein